MKAIILKGRNNNSRSNNRSNSNKSNNSRHNTIKHPFLQWKHFTKSNLYELLNELIVESNESEDNAVVTEDVIDNNDSTLLVNSTTINKINSRDIRKLISTHVKGNSTPSSTKRLSLNLK